MQREGKEGERRMEERKGSEEEDDGRVAVRMEKLGEMLSLARSAHLHILYV